MKAYNHLNISRLDFQMPSTLSVVISCFALLISAITSWLTFFRRGTIKMTQPTTVFFGPDGKEGYPKVFLRTLLYSTSQRGQIVESVFVRLRRRESVQAFNVWIYGERGELVRGSGLFVGQEGVACNHHFLFPPDGTNYEFLAGDYEVEVYVKLVNSSKSKLLWQLRVSLTEQQAREMKGEKAGVYFDWGSDSRTYHSHIDRRPGDEKFDPEFFEAMAKTLRGEKPNRVKLPEKKGPH